MDGQAISTKKVAINYGAVLGVATILLSVILYVLNMHMEQNFVTGLIGVLIIGVVVVMGISKFKKLNGNVLSLGQALKTGLGIAAVGGLIAVLYTLLFIYVIEPDFMVQMGDMQREAMLEQNPDMTQDQIATAEKYMSMFSSPWMISIMSMLYTLFIGLIVSLIAGLIMKNNR